MKRYIPQLKVTENVSEEQILRLLANLGVSCFFNYIYPIRPEESQPLNEYNYQLSKRVKNAVCFGSLHPENSDREDILKEVLIDFDLIGLKFHPYVQGFSILDSRLEGIYRIMEEMGRPIVLHTGFDLIYKATPIGVNEVDKILTKHPGLVMVIAHMFYPRVEHAFHLLERHKNVYLDGTNLFSDYREPETGENALEGILEKNSGSSFYRVSCSGFSDQLEKYSEKIILGSDYPVGINDPEKIYSCMQSISLSDEAKYNLIEGTARRFVTRFKPNFFN